MISKKKFGTTVTAFGSWNASRFGSTGSCGGDGENGAGNAERTGRCTVHTE